MRGRMDPQIRDLLDAAVEDRELLDGKISSRNFGFHAQQAIEKLLKALIAAHGVTFPWTHDLRSLLADVQGLGEQLPTAVYPILGLQPYATVFRYSTAPVLVESDREPIRQSIDALQTYVKTRIDELMQP